MTKSNCSKSLLLVGLMALAATAKAQQPDQHGPRNMLMDETIANEEDSDQYKTTTTNAHEQQMQNHHPVHHTFASARHDHHHHHNGPDMPPLPNNADGGSPSVGVASSTIGGGGGGGSGKNNRKPANDNNVITVTEKNGVTIQKSYLPYGAQGHDPNEDCDPEDTQYIVTCEPDTKNDCYQQLDEIGIRVVKMMRFTDYFAICIEKQDDDVNDEKEKAILESIEALGKVKHVEYDPIRELAQPHSIRGSSSSFASNEKKKKKKDATERLRRHLTMGTSGFGQQEHDEQQHARDLGSSGQQQIYGLDLMQVPEFWNEYPPSEGQGVTVCIIDTGLLLQHEDFDQSKMSGSSSSDLVQPWSDDGYTHGTHVTGIVAASDNDVGVVGVCPECNIFVSRVFDGEGVFRASSLIEAMKECKVGGADIINMSIGGDSTSLAEKNKVDELYQTDDILIVAAAGNFAMEENVFSFPGGYDNVFSVGAVDQNSDIAEFSCFNEQVTAVSAGVGIYSTTADGPRKYGFLSGTSQASPYVAGAAALLRNKFPDKKASEIWQAMTTTAKDLGACGNDPVFGAGLIQVLDAAKYLEDPSSFQTSPASDGGGGSSCIKTEVKVKMPANEDLSGNTTRFDIQVKSGNDYAFAYRAGIFQLGEEYSFEFNLQSDACYRMVFWDEAWKGFDSSAGGYYELIHNGEQIKHQDYFTGDDEEVAFGNCGGGSTATASQQENTERNTGNH